MSRYNKPSDIHKKNFRRLTKRRMLKILISAGISASTANAVTAEDVQDASSDQIPISLDSDGNSIVYVYSDWYDHLKRARDVKYDLEREWITGRNTKDTEDDVYSVWLDAGKRGDNPHVILTIDKNSSSKNETRGRIPEYRDNVRIDIEEAERKYKYILAQQHQIPLR